MVDQSQAVTNLKIQEKDIEVIGNPEDTPSIYIDGMQGIIGARGIVRIGVYQYVQKPAKTGDPADATSVQKLMVGRLIMTEETMASLGKWLTEQSAQREKSKPAVESKQETGTTS